MDCFETFSVYTDINNEYVRVVRTNYDCTKTVVRRYYWGDANVLPSLGKRVDSKRLHVKVDNKQQALDMAMGFRDGMNYAGLDVLA